MIYKKSEEPITCISDGRTLPGFRKKSFLLPFAGGEIWFEHLDGIYQYSELAIEKLRMDSPAFHRPSSSAHIAFVLDETVITDELIRQIADELLHTTKHFMRIAMIGADKNAQRKLKKVLSGAGFALKFFDGIDPAKEWLVSEVM
ncbi:MAG: hypothetical protein ACI3XR_10270 [Eubacteriales bacterium]